MHHAIVCMLHRLNVKRIWLSLHDGYCSMWIELILSTKFHNVKSFCITTLTSQYSHAVSGTSFHMRHMDRFLCAYRYSDCSSGHLLVRTQCNHILTRSIDRLLARITLVIPSTPLPLFVRIYPHIPHSPAHQFVRSLIRDGVSIHLKLHSMHNPFREISIISWCAQDCELWVQSSG